MTESDDRGFFPPLEHPAWRAAPSFVGIAASAGLVAVAAIIGSALVRVLPLAGMSLVFIVAVLLSATSFGFWTGLIAAILAFLTYNFFFVEPIHTLSVTHPQDVLALIAFLFVAALTGLLAGRLREEAHAARRRAAMLELIAQFSAELSAIEKSEEIERLIVGYLARISDGPAAVLRQNHQAPVVTYAMPDGIELDGNSLQAADWVFRHAEPVAATALGWTGNRFAFYPLKNNDVVVAVAGVSMAAAEPADQRERERAIFALLRQSSDALNRVTLAREANEARAAAEQERLRSALLSSISHDLRTPLATILGSVTSLRELEDSLSSETRADLLLAIEEEAGRLSRFVTNLLAMTKLEAGINITLDWVDVVDAVNSAVDRIRRAFPKQTIVTSISPALPPVRADMALLEQVVFNLIDNAVRYSPPDKAVEVIARNGEGAIEMTVTDCGAGIPATEKTRIFDKFYTRSASGIGLGLSICQGVVALFHGSIAVESPLSNGMGTRFIVRLPIVYGDTSEPL